MVDCRLKTINLHLASTPTQPPLYGVADTDANIQIQDLLKTSQDAMDAAFPNFCY